MDTSKEYILMCKAAAEVQNTLFEINSPFIFDSIFARLEPPTDQIHLFASGLTGSFSKNFTKEIWTWLPRLDQLAQLHENWNHKYSFCFFAEMDTNSKFYPIALTNLNGAQLSFDSLEKHMLCHYMWHKYSKIWDERKLLWYTNAERVTPEQKAENEKQQVEWEKKFKDSRMDEI
jgi:hypothetical protein